MATRRLKHQLANLNNARKWILLSAVLVAFSTLMPWYEDLDAFGAGDLYLGVTGPLFLVGLMVLVSAVFVGAWIVLPLMDKRLPQLPVKEGALFTFLGFQDLLLLLVANSVFFHPKFGVNITLKDTRFGMILAFVGTILMIWSGYKLYKRDSRRASLRKDVRTEPLVKMPESGLQRGEEPRPVRRGRDLVDRAVDTLNREAGRPVRREPVDRTPGEDRPSPQPLRMDL